MNNEKEKKCWKCGKTIVGKSKLGLCKRCADDGERNLIPVIVFLIGYTVKKKALPFLSKTIFKL